MMMKMKIQLQLTPFYTPTGAELQLIEASFLSSSVANPKHMAQFLEDVLQLFGVFLNPWG